MRRQMVCAIALGLAISTVGSAATLFYDFGDGGATRITPGNYNNITVSAPINLSIADSVDSTGALTGISLDAADFWPGSNTSGPGVAGNPAASIFAPEAYVDNAFGNTSEFGGATAPLATITMGGLDGSGATLYDFTFFGSRTGVSSPTESRQTQYAVSGANSSVALLEVANNLSEVTGVSGIVPTAAGTITIEVSPGPANNNSFGFYYLGAMRVESSPVPEPATFGLLAIAGLAFTLQRRGRS